MGKTYGRIGSKHNLFKLDLPFGFLDFHILFTNFGQGPLVFWKTIKGSLHLICIINRFHKRATSKQCQKQDGGGILRLCNARFSCCLIVCHLSKQIVQRRKQCYAKKKHISLLGKLRFICKKNFYEWTTYLTVIFTNHVGLFRHISSNQTLETTTTIG